MKDFLLSDADFLKFSEKLSKLENDISVSTESSYRYKREGSNDSIVVDVHIDRILKAVDSDSFKYDRMASLNVEMYFKKNCEV